MKKEYTITHPNCAEIDFYPDRYYMHEFSGDVQLGSDWIADYESDQYKDDFRDFTEWCSGALYEVEITGE